MTQTQMIRLAKPTNGFSLSLHGIAVIATLCTALFSGVTAVHAARHPKAAPPIMGWSSWNHFAFGINEDVFKSQADAMVEKGLTRVGYRFINMDSGFWDGRAEDGTLQISREQFPNGLRALTDYIHSRGLKAGFYSDGGSLVCGNGSPQHTGVGLLHHEEEDLRLALIDWNYDFIKVDFCGGWGAKLVPREQFSKISGIIRRLKPETVYNICSGLFPGTWAHGVANSARTGMDISLSWESLRTIIKWNLCLQAFTRGGFHNDLDMMEIGRGFTPDEERLHMAYWCISSSPLIMGCDLTKLDGESLQLATNTDLIAMDQDPLGIGAPVVQRDGEVYVVAKDMERVNGKRRAVVVMNLSDSEQEIDLDLELLGFRGKVRFYNCFTHRRLPDRPEGTFRVRVPAHGCQAYFVSGRRTEKRLFQAEEAWLQGCQFVTPKRSIQPMENATADQGYCVGVIGNDPEEYLRWDNVCSQRGGRYRMDIRYATDHTERTLTLWLNGERIHRFKHLQTTGEEDWQTLSVDVTLQRGQNTVKLGDDAEPAPNIDCMRLTPLP